MTTSLLIILRTGALFATTDALPDANVPLLPSADAFVLVRNFCISCILVAK